LAVLSEAKKKLVVVENPAATRGKLICAAPPILLTIRAPFPLPKASNLNSKVSGYNLHKANLLIIERLN
jgi:hypothetical protein